MKRYILGWPGSLPQIKGRKLPALIQLLLARSLPQDLIITELGCHDNTSCVIVSLLWLILRCYFYLKNCWKFLETLLQEHENWQLQLSDEDVGIVCRVEFSSLGAWEKILRTRSSPNKTMLMHLVSAWNSETNFCYPDKNLFPIY
jgi:hypothetical protein